MKRFYFLLFSICISLILYGCKSEQEKALETAIATNDLNQLRVFASSIEGEMESKVKIKYDDCYATLLKDSTLYSNIKQAENIIARYNYEKEYLAELPSGIHFEEVNQMLTNDKEQAEIMTNKLAEMRNAFSQYRFIETTVDGWQGGVVMTTDGDEYEFNGPDEFGKGEVTIKAEGIPIKYQFFDDDFNFLHMYALIKRNCVGTYYVNNDLKIELSIKETRTYSKHPDTDKSYREKYFKEMITDLKKQYPAPAVRKVILNFEVYDFPSLSGIDSNNNGCNFRAVIK